MKKMSFSKSSINISLNKGLKTVFYSSWFNIYFLTNFSTLLEQSSNPLNIFSYRLNNKLFQTLFMKVYWTNKINSILNIFELKVH